MSRAPEDPDFQLVAHSACLTSSFMPLALRLCDPFKTGHTPALDTLLSIKPYLAPCTHQISKAKKSNKIKISLHLLMLTGDSGIEEGLSAMLRSIPTSLLLRFLCKEHRLQVELRSSLIVSSLVFTIV